jgi:hypothetical protein
MLMVRGTDWHKDLSPEEIQQAVGQMMTWFQDLLESGSAIGGNPLAPTGRVVKSGQGGTILDGPFAETKETIGGYFMLTTTDLDEAVQIARQCPGLKHGIELDVRPVLDTCHHAETAANAEAHAATA